MCPMGQAQERQTRDLQVLVSSNVCERFQEMMYSYHGSAPPPFTHTALFVYPFSFIHTLKFMLTTFTSSN